MVLRLIFSEQPLWKILIFCQLYSAVSRHSVIASNCDDGHDVFAKVKENSLMGTFIANLSFTAQPSSSNHLHLKLSGKDADWFYLEGRTIRLNSTSTRIIDREIHGSVLTATVRCYEHKALQAEHRILVEVLNENDNKPEFLQRSVQPLQLSELTAVNSVVFTVQATDADGDTLTYVIDETSPDARYFRVDLHNSGKVVLNKPLDYEIKTQLRLTLYAVETNTNEHYNTTATIIISVIDGDDQYPQFQPCTLLSANHSNRICANPLYTANITENEQDIVLDFFPGPIQAVDGDEGLRTPVKYTILSGADNGRFVIDSNSGEVRLTRRVENRLLIPTLRLRVMAAQTDDPLKYAVATVLVRVLAENRFPPQFSRSTYHGFVSERANPASLVMTYGNKLLILEATDQDFTEGFNPRQQYSLNSQHNSSQLFYITQEGLLIAKTRLLHPGHKYFLEVLATDLESGDTVKAALHVEVLQKGQPVPQGPLGAGHVYSGETVGRAEGVAGVCLILLGVTLFTLVRCIRMIREKRDPVIRTSVADNRHPNVCLRWFRMMNQSQPMTLVEETFSYHNEVFSEYDHSASPFYGKQGIYTKIEEPPPSTSVDLPSVPINKSLREPRRNYLALRPNGRPVNRFNNKTVSFHDYVVVREWDEESEENTETTFTTEVEICPDLEEMDCELESDDSDLPEEELQNQSQIITSYCDDICIESEKLHMHLKRVNRDCETHNTEDKIHAKPQEIRDQKIAGKHRFKSDLQRHSTESPETDRTVTQNTTHAELSIFQIETYIIDPKALVSEADKPVVNYSESFKTDGTRKSDDLNLDPQVSVAESSVQNIHDVINLQTHLSTLTLDPGQYNGSEERLGVETDNTPSSNIYYVNEDIATNLDDSSPEEESISNLDTSSQHLNYLHDPHDTQIEYFYYTDTDETNDGR
ncbi:protocadherin beta-10 [Carassius gibelio]|uniref:protocadherin beta-10 n=1 Tax=Carassius gibelio TaxID=101364 RepID=UPI0022779482|nr:protocadherin beta-10 [Carassius gibelio]